MIALVTGANGYLGERLCFYLLQHKYKVRALVRSKARSKGLVHEHIELVEGDLHNTVFLEKQINGCHVVFHAAAMATVWARDKTLFFKVNATLSQNIFALSLKLNVSKVVFISTVGTFGPSPDGITDITENHVRYIDYFTEYESSKALAEQWALKYALQGLNVSILNVSRIYGPGQMSESNAATLMIQKIHEGKWKFLPGDGKSTGNYVFIDDVLQACLLAVDRGKAGEQYFIGDENLSFNDFFNRVTIITGHKYGIFHVPKAVIMLVSKISLLLAELFGVQPRIVPKWALRYSHQWRVSNQKAKDELGLKTTGFDEGVRLTLALMKNKDLQK